MRSHKKFFILYFLLMLSCSQVKNKSQDTTEYDFVVYRNKNSISIEINGKKFNDINILSKFKKLTFDNYKVKEIAFINNNLSDKALSVVTNFNNIRSLIFENNKITDKGVNEYLCKLTTLQQVSIQDTLISTKGLICLLKQNKNINFLNITGCDIRQEAMPFILSLSNLERLIMADMRVSIDTPENNNLIKAKFPKCDIISQHTLGK